MTELLAHSRELTAVPTGEFGAEARPQWRTVARRFLRHRLAVAATVVLAVIALWAFGVATVWPHSYTELDTARRSLAPSRQHPFGTDDLGKDVFARVMRGTQRTLEIAVIVSVLSTVIGVTVGAIAGYFRGWIDTVLMRITDLMLIIPLLIIVGVMSASVPTAPWYVIPLLLGLFSSPLMARITGPSSCRCGRRSLSRPRVLGTPRRRIIFRHILPNCRRPDHRQRHAHRGRRHPHRDGAVIPRPRGSRAGGVARFADQHVPERLRHSAVVVLVSVADDRRDLAVRQLHRRRSSLRVRPSPGPDAR